MKALEITTKTTSSLTAQVRFCRSSLSLCFCLETMLWSCTDLFLSNAHEGQIELYTHFPIMSQLVKTLTNEFNINLCATYLLESQFMQDRHKFFAGVMSAMSCMINLECPHVNILSKMDLVNKNSREMERYEQVDPSLLQGAGGKGKWKALNEAMVQLVRVKISRYLSRCRCLG